jgi:hypothetical protein
MGSVDLVALEARARRKYELTRARNAVLGFTPALLLVAIAALANHHRASALLFGGGMFVIGSVLLWYGRELRRAVLPGLAMGVVPLTMALCANYSHHVCMGGSCLSLCVPACTAGGLAAGIGLALLGRRERGRLGFWLAGSTLALATGAMGCACVGFSGVLGLAVGYVIGLVPLAVTRWRMSPTKLT